MSHAGLLAALLSAGAQRYLSAIVYAIPPHAGVLSDALRPRCMLYVTSPVPACSTAEMFYGNQYEFTSLVRELDAPGELGQAKPPSL